MQASHAFLRLARQIKKLECPICGLWPIRGFWSIGASAISQNLPVDLAKALASLGDSTGIIVRQQDWQDGPPELKPSIEVVSDGVDSIRPIQVRASAAATLERALATAHDRYSQVLLDLSGLDIVSLTEVVLLPDVGILLLMAPGATSDLALAKLRRRLPSERLLGVVFVEPEPRESAAHTSPSQGR
jgi:hypothetical protein